MASGPHAPQIRAPERPAAAANPAPWSAAPSPASHIAAMATADHRAPVVPPERAINNAGPIGASGSAIDAALVEGETLRFTIPTDGTVEFLPGRLEVVAGPDTGREIRFVRAPGETEVEVTFGRSEGPAHRHVQVLARTVSRRHAVMSLIDEHWQLANTSTTNPLVLNGRVLAPNEVAPLLIEGDRLEMGEVVFVFHDA
jgi:hypothetical protein